MIREIKWHNHKILGNLELNFTKPDGTPYNTIVLAGENGVGKTTILETLATFLNLETMEPFEYIKYIVDGIPYTISPEGDLGKYGFHSRKNETSDEMQTIHSGRDNNRARIEEDTADLRHYGFSYSKARSGFNTGKIKSTTTQQLDSQKYENDSKEDFTLIKQLIVDINAQDNSEWMRLTRAGSSTTFNEFEHCSKMFRFEKAFNDFFDIVRFKGIDDTNKEEIKILFEKHGKDISVDSLSTGEKQVVFRGAHLLKNSNSMVGGVVLLDEPELSMHPKWQQKVLEYYRSLFTAEGVQNAQMIFATHSEYVLNSALNDRDNVLIITLTDDNGIIQAKNITAPSTLPTITSAETNYLAFGVSEDYRTLADNLSTSKVYVLDARPAVLSLAANERVTEIMFVFGNVRAGFAQVETPYIYATARSGLANNSSIVNVADVGGLYDGQWIQAVSRWLTTIYAKTTVRLPKTGY